MDVATVLPAYMKFHFTQAVCGIREQYSLERAQGKGGGSQKPTCASTALDSKSESIDSNGLLIGPDGDPLSRKPPLAIESFGRGRRHRFFCGATGLVLLGNR